MLTDNNRIMNLLLDDGFTTFCQINRIRLAILFGSRAAGLTRDESDFDLAVLLDTDYPQDVLARGSQKRKLLHNLATHFSSSRIDLVILNDASPFLVYRVTQTGKVLYEAADGEFARLASLAIRQHSDGRLFRELEQKYLTR